MFSEIAPAYWAAGIPVIPLRPCSKVPAPNAWQSYKDQMPSAETQAQWLEAYPDGNIGLPLGAQSGMIVLDLDSPDPAILHILEKIMPHSPWRRVGKKGAVYAFKFSGERTIRIKDEAGNMILEILASSSQVVLPPSIHPDTMRPYEANCELLSVIDKLLPLPVDFEQQFRSALIAGGVKLSTRGSLKVTDWVPAGGRDSALVGQAGLWARAVIRGEVSLLEAIYAMEVWTGSYTERVVGDELDPDKGRQKVMEFLRRDVEGGKQLPSRWLLGMSAEEVQESRAYFGEDGEVWSVEKIMEDLTEKLVATPVSETIKRSDIIDECLIRMNRSPNLGDIKEEMVLRFIAQSSGGNVGLGALRRRMQTLKGKSVEGVDHTEIAKAVIEASSQYGELRYNSGAFYHWVGSHWEMMPEVEIAQMITKDFGHLPAARKHGDHRGIMATCKTLVTSDLRSTGEIGINFANGFLTVDGELLTHDERFGATYVLPYRWLVDAPAPLRFMGFLDSCWGHNPDYSDRVQALREIMAATLFGQAWRFSRALLLYGLSHTGKSTTKKIMEGLLPPGATCSVPPHDWANLFLPAQMNHKLVNFCGELSESAIIAGDKFKAIVEGEEMSGQLKGEQIFRFRPTCAQWFASNHLPKTKDTSQGFNRRWLILHFDKPVPVAEKNSFLDQEILFEEREAIVAWVVPAMQDLMRKQDYTLPACHEDLIVETSVSNNNVEHFLQENMLVIGPGSVTEREAYFIYYNFARGVANSAAVPMKKFNLMMTELSFRAGFTVAKADDGSTVYRGLEKPVVGSKAAKSG